MGKRGNTWPFGVNGEIWKWSLAPLTEMDGWPCGQHKAWSHARGVKARKLVNYFRVDLYASQMRFQHRGPSLPREGFGEGEVGEDGMGGWEDGGWIFYRSDREDRNQYVRPRTARSTQIFPKHDMPRLIAPNSLSGRVKHTNKSYSAGRQLSWRDVIVSLTCRRRIVGDMTTVCMCVCIYIYHVEISHIH